MQLAVRCTDEERLHVELIAIWWACSIEHGYSVVKIIDDRYLGTNIDALGMSVH